MATATHPVADLTPDEMTQRRRAVNNTVGTLRIEGMELEPDEYEVLERYARGEIDLAEVRAQMQASAAAIVAA